MNTYAQVWDVNINRLREAWRVLEEVARFVLKDQPLALRFKDWRQQLNGLQGAGLLIDRDSENDCGRTVTTPAESRRRDWRDITLAASKRAQEALRVLEEVGKLKISNDRPSPDFKAWRFAMYDCEKEIFLRLAACCRKRLPEPLLYLVLTPHLCAGRDPLAVAAAALAGGVRAVQLRCKKTTDREKIALGKKLKELCQQHQALFIVNDRPDLALLLDADGVHLGQGDLTAAAARKIVGPEVMIGISTHNLAQLGQVDVEVADYAALGPIYPTRTKEGPDPVLGPEIWEKITHCDLPLVAIGGITPAVLPELLAQGCRRIAVVTGLTEAIDVEREAKRYLEFLH